MGSVVKKITKPFKKVAKKIVPKEAAGIMQMAAPFIAPYSVPASLALSGLGQLRGRGKINPLMLALASAPGWGRGAMDPWRTAAERAQYGPGWLRQGIQKIPGEFGKYDRTIDELLFGTDWEKTIGKPSHGWLGSIGEYNPLEGTIAGKAFKEKKFPMVKGVKVGEPFYEGLDLLKSVAWGSARKGLRINAANRRIIWF